jgi:hypothetical protein
MKGDRVWRALSSGPGWTDIRLYARSIEEAHGCTVYVHMQPLMSTGGAQWHITAVAQLMVFSSPGKAISVAAAGSFPTINHKSLESFVYALLVKLDWDIGSEQYIQQPLPLA